MPILKSSGPSEVTLHVVRSIVGSFVVLLFLLSGGEVAAQTTEFTYQGSLRDGPNPANGNYDFEFLLFDAVSAGSQQGPLLARSGVPVSNGIFAVSLDFGNQFPGASRFLEIRVRVAGGGSFTPLLPRQAMASTPYSVRSLDTAQFNGQGASFYRDATNINAGTLDNGRLGQIPTANIADNAVTAQKIAGGQVVKSVNSLTDNVTLTAGSNISITPAGNTLTIAATGGGSGCPSPCTAAVFNATQEYQLAGSRVLSGGGANNLFVGTSTAVTGTTGIDNTFVGTGAGSNSTSGGANTFVGVSAGFNNLGDSNSFFGRSAGFQNVSGNNNSFFGVQAGRDNLIGADNSFFGHQAGMSNANGFGNSYFGTHAGRDNTSASGNSFFGFYAGEKNSGADNSFFGTIAGSQNTSGTDNSFFGRGAGLANMTGNDNSFFGRSAGANNTTGEFNSFFGRGAGLANTTGARNAYLGYRAGENSTGSFNTMVGGDVGRTNITGSLNVFVGYQAGKHNTGGASNVFIGADAGENNTTGSSNTALGDIARVGAGNLSYATAIGAGTTVTASNRIQLGRVTLDTVAIGAFGPSATSTHVCIDPQGVFTQCSSSLRYKENVRPLNTGLSFLMQLRPIRFTWKGSGHVDIGFGAEDVAKADEEFTFRNSKGQIEGVKYEQMAAVFVNAIKEQQAQIEAQKKRIEEQQAEIDALKAIVCAGSKAHVCGSQK